MGNLNRAHTWIYGLIYPAFLGAVLVGLFADGLPDLLDPLTAWTVALTLYFLTQYGEGMEARSSYSSLEAVGDLLEVAAMAVAFFSIGALSVSHIGALDWWTSGSVAAALAVPFVKRLILRRGITLRSILSVIAIAAVVAQQIPIGTVIGPWESLLIFGIALLAYIIDLVRPGPSETD